MPRETRTIADLPAATQARLAAEQAVREAQAWLATNGQPTAEQIDTMVDAAFPDPSHTAAQRAYLKRIGQAVVSVVRMMGVSGP